MAVRWRSHEDDRLRRLYRSDTPLAVIAQELGRSEDAIWTEGDDSHPRQILSARSVDSAAQVLGRTPEAIRRRARTLDLPLTPPAAGARAGTRWTLKEDRLLCLHAGLNPAVLSGLVGRSDQAIAARLRHLGLRAGREGSPHHPSPSVGGLTQGERRLVERELRRGGYRMPLTLQRRLQKPLDAIRAATAER